MTTRRNLLFVGLSLGFLASCGPPPETPTYPDLRFTGQPPLLLDAGPMSVLSLFQPTETDRAFPVPPLQAVQNWARDRLRTSGKGGPARFTIRDASAVVKDLPVKGGVSGTFTDQASQDYTVAVDVTLEILDTRNIVVRTVHVTAARSQSVLQSATPNDRDKARYELVKALMTDFDRQMDQQIHDNFGLYLLSR